MRIAQGVPVVRGSKRSQGLLRVTPFGLIACLLSVCVFWVVVFQVALNGSLSVNPLGYIQKRPLPAREQLLGQYSPWFSVFSELPAETPPECEISFVQVLSRHGSRYPTTSKSQIYNQTIAKIHQRTQRYSSEYAFLKDYEYTLGADDLTKFGENELFNSGVHLYNRYKNLARKRTPFIRASGVGRVLSSAQFFSDGYHAAKINDSAPDNHPYNILVIGEYPGSNNTLNHGLCTAFETPPISFTAPYEQALWFKKLHPILKRVSRNLGGIHLSDIDLITLMDLCPFEMIASTDGPLISPPFCALFSMEEWEKYEYFQDLGKYYGYGSGNLLGPTQGVGFVNELIARMTNTTVRDHTCVNHTLDSSPSTFPLGLPLYADFGHDNDITSVLFALGLYDLLPTHPSKKGHVGRGGYSASTTVPFAARIYVEKMTCTGSTGELVRVIVNDRVVPLQNCGADKLGRCTMQAFVDSQGFARRGGNWDRCSDSDH